MQNAYQVPMRVSGARCDCQILIAEPRTKAAALAGRTLIGTSQMSTCATGRMGLPRLLQHP